MRAPYNRSRRLSNNPSATPADKNSLLPEFAFRRSMGASKRGCRRSVSGSLSLGNQPFAFFRRFARPRRYRPVSSPWPRHHRPKRQQRFHLRAHGADLQSRRARSQQNDPVERRPSCNRNRRWSRRLTQERWRHALHSASAPGERRVDHPFGFSRGTQQDESARRISLHSDARLVFQRARKRRHPSTRRRYAI